MNPFAPRNTQDIADFVREQVFGLVVTHDDQGYISTPLPLLAETEPDGEVHAIIGHFARANPHVSRLERQPRALISFLGPHGYVAPEWVGNPRWAPTWNYQLAEFEVEIELQPDRGGEAIQMLVDAMESGKPAPWNPAAMGDRYAVLAERVIAFRALVTGRRARFKLGQDEDRATFAEILEGMGDTPLAAAMRRQARPIDGG